MSGALWHFFWTDTDWTGSPPSPPPPGPPGTPLPPPPPPGSGAGSGDGKDEDPAGDLAGFWELREAYLKSLFAEPAPPPPLPLPDDYADLYRAYEERRQEIERLAGERAGAYAEMRGTSSISEMKQVGARIKTLNARIAELETMQVANKRYRR